MTETRYPRVFISYSHEDKNIAQALAEELANNGIDPWYDAWEIRAGDSLIEKVFEEGLKDCAVFIVLLSPSSVESSWVRNELDVAMINRIRRLSKVVPIVTEETEIPVSLRALKRLYLAEGIDSIVREIVDVAYDRSIKKPLIRPEPERIGKMIAGKYGFSSEAATIGAAIARSIDPTEMSTQYFEGKSLQAELDLTPEQINDAVDEMAVRGLVEVHKELGTGEFDFGFFELTYAFYYTFSEYLTEDFNPERDARQVAATLASHKQMTGQQLADELDFSPLRVNCAVDYLTDYGVIKTIRTFGTAPYNFAEAYATSATRRFIRE